MKANLVSARNKVVDGLTWMKTKLVCGKNKMVDAYTWMKTKLVSHFKSLTEAVIAVLQCILSFGISGCGKVRKILARFSEMKLENEQTLGLVDPLVESESSRE